MGGAIGSSLGVVGVGGGRWGAPPPGTNPCSCQAPLVETGQRAGLDVGDQRPGELQLRPEQRHLVLALDGEQAGGRLGGDVVGRLHLVEADLDRLAAPPQQRDGLVGGTPGRNESAASYWGLP